MLELQLSRQPTPAEVALLTVRFGETGLQLGRWLQWLDPNILADLWEFTPLGSRLPELEPVWAHVKGMSATMGPLSQQVIDQFNQMAPMIDQSPEEALVQCQVVEQMVGEMVCYMFTPNSIADQTDKPALIFFRGAAFVMGSAQHARKQAANMAIRYDCVVILPDVGTGPEVNAPQIIENAQASLRWLTGAADSLGVNASRIGIWGESSGGWIGLALCRVLARVGEADQVKFFVSDIGALDNDFVDFAATPEQEPDEMHQVCSKMHLQTWATIFSDDLDGTINFDWAPKVADPEIFPAQMEPELLQKIPKTVLMTAEFDHVGRRCAEKFAARLRNEAPDRLVGVHIQPGGVHGMYGSGEEQRNEASKRIVGALL